MTTLNIVLLWTLALVALAIGLYSTRRRSGVFQFPFLAASVVLGWALPQLIGLALNEPGLQGPISKTIFYTIVFLIFGWIGYVSNRRPARLMPRAYARSRLLLAGYLLSFFGAYFFFRVSSLSAEATALNGGQWTGSITIYAFFATTLSVGTTIAMVLVARRPDAASLFLLLFGLTFILHRVFVAGRREDAMDLFVMILYFTWFRFRWVPPRWSVFALIVFGALFVASVGEYRTAMRLAEVSGQTGSGFSSVAQIDFVGNFAKIVSDPMHYQELLNAVMIIEGVERSGKLDLGLSLWNGFVHRYVPGQLVGYDVKTGLSFPLANVAFDEMGHVFYTGTTWTGMAESFRSFWYFGVLEFFLIGRIMNRWYRAAEGGNVAAQIIVVLLTTKSILTISHGTNLFFVEFVFIAVFVSPALYFARGHARPSAVYRISAPRRAPGRS